MEIIYLSQRVLSLAAHVTAEDCLHMFKARQSEARKFPNRAAAMEASDDAPLSPPDGKTIGDVIAQRYNRRDIVKGAFGVAAATALLGPAALAARESQTGTGTEVFSFEEIAAGANKDHHVAKGYNADVLLRWGDPIRADMAAFDPQNQSAEEQAKRFGYNNDYIAYFPIDGSSHRGLLCINHEFTNEELMFPGLSQEAMPNSFTEMTEDLTKIEKAAVGVTVIEVYRDEGGAWHVDETSTKNRRITANSLMTFDGPVTKNPDRLKTNCDPACENLRGTFNNCAGGHTPWGTYLTAEENIHGAFWTDDIDANYKSTLDPGDERRASFERYRMPSRWQAWGKYDARFNVDKEPNEPNRFGWIVEFDPFDENAVPVKNTALGRFFHEGAETVVSKDGHAVVYSGDDSKNEYVYRFVSSGRYAPGDKKRNMTLLEDGTLYAARFNSDGTGDWLPLVYGQGKLTKKASDGRYESQADVVIDARLAADDVGATKMDRPEDVQPNDKTGRIYVMLTNNVSRTVGNTDAANPRPKNKFGHIIEMVSDGGDFAANTFRWEILVRCGDPGKPESGASWNAATTADGWFVCPDNAVVDHEGQLWIATDQGKYWQDKSKHADGLYALETEGPGRGTPRMFFRVPVGGELCGPCFTPDGTTLFVSVQHPAADGTDGYADFSGPSTFENPATRWPDFEDGMPPRPSVVVITKKGGGKIG